MTLRVLVVDDNTDNADLLAEVLSSGGHDVRVAYDGTSALARLGEAPSDVVFLDIGLPDMSGYDVASKIRVQFGANVRLVALTGFSGREARDRATDAGFDAFVGKPFAVADVLKALG
ncbi:hypothetical protein BH09MYX1_BH09MYX1_22420 [soil metagenome]